MSFFPFSSSFFPLIPLVHHLCLHFSVSLFVPLIVLRPRLSFFSYFSALFAWTFFNSITPLPLTPPPSSTHFLVSANHTCPIFISSFFCYPSAILTPLFPLGFFFFPFPCPPCFPPSTFPFFLPSFLHSYTFLNFLPFLIFCCLLSGGTSLPSVHPTISSSAACSQSVPQFRCWLPWIQRLWTGNRKRRSQLQTLPPTGGQGLPYWFLLRLKLHLPHGKSGNLLAQACFTSSA